MASIGGYVVFNLSFTADAGQIVSVCEELGLVAYGKTQEEAQARILRTVEVALGVASQEGMLEDYLKSHGVMVERGIRTLPEASANTEVKTTIAVAPLPAS